MTISRANLDDLVKSGLATDIFKMERAVSLLKGIGERAKEINTNHRGVYAKLFAEIQNALTTEAVLSASRLFDTPNKKHQTRCLMGVLEYLRDHRKELPGIREPHQLRLTLESIRAPQNLIEAMSDPEEFAIRLSTYVRSELESPSRIEVHLNLKTLRDRSFAHNDSVERISGPSWDSLVDLVGIAKNVVGVLGWAYLSTAYFINGSYILTDDARSCEYALRKALDVLISKSNQ